MTTPTGTLELALLQRLATSPFTRRRFWDARPRLAVVAGERAWVIRDHGWFDADEAPVDGTIRCSPEDLAAMARGAPPTGTVTWTLGPRAAPERRKQACAVLALAAMGWCGPWPDPDADPSHVPMVRAALYDLGIGPADATAPLFPPGGPLPDVRVRLTHTAAGVELVTDGLADTPGRPELAAISRGRSDPRGALPALRAAALWCAERGAPPRRLPLGPRALDFEVHPAFPDGLPLPHQLTWLHRVRFEE